ncbi:MAG: hypothetical protein AAGG68_27850 [Bacteroidota bacterium]
MQYTLVRNFFSRSNRFAITDIHQQPAYQVSKKSSGIFSSVFLLQGEISEHSVTIKRRSGLMKTGFSIYEDDYKVAELTRKMKMLRSHFYLEFLEGTTIQIECDTWRKNYVYYKGDEVIAKLKRRSKKMKRVYELTCLEMKHHEILMATVVALDQILDQDSSG